ncbi:MAG: adenylate/guanylate cyclase domain-containing protein, partial [Terriglobia bacterium]
LGGERREVSVLFCDIRNFTTLAEGIPPEASVEMLNDFFTAMTGVVFTSGGLVDKFVGDQIMAFWGAPVERADHAARACAAALEMMEEFRRLRTRWAQSHPTRQTMNCGVGINSGPMVVGNIGSARRFSYTVIGDNVNVASRLEALNKLYGTQMLVGPATYAAVRERLRFREIDQVRVRGRTQTLTVYELLGRREEPGLGEDWLVAFAEGLAAYRRREWAAASEAFAAARTRNPADACAEFYLRRAQQFAENPPPEEWEGVHYLR